MNTAKIQYAKNGQSQFYMLLKKRVNTYFKEANISKKGGSKLLVKGLLVLSIWLVPYFLILTQELNEGLMLGLCVMMGTGMCLVGTNIMHEGCHGTFSAHPLINRLAAGTMYLLGGDKLIWQTSHNVLHHSYTNIYGHDVDLEAGNGIIRFTDQTDWAPKHRYQHVYAFFLYSLLTITWVFLTDFVKMKRFAKEKLLIRSKNEEKANWRRLILFKLIAWSFWLLLPILVLDLAIWKILLGFLLMHITAGLALTMIFQLAHLTEISEMPLPDDQGNMENIWAIHQLHTTANWAMESPFLNWCTGGLNYQIEHHLFPGISHVHYKAIAPIIQETALEFEIPYYKYTTMKEALSSHYSFLKQLGEKPKAVFNKHPENHVHPG